MCRKEIFYDEFLSPLGRVGLVYIEKTGPVVLKVMLRPLEAPSGVLRKALPERIKGQFLDYLEGNSTVIDVAYMLTGTEFCKSIWQKTRAIPYGQTRTYQWLAEAVGRPKALRAVGQALKKNPLPLIIPCHRVVGSDGSLVGFSAGIEIKRFLLDLERKGAQKDGPP